MKIAARLYFSQMQAPAFGKILISSHGGCIGKSAFDVLGIDAVERDFFVKSLLHGSAPIVILGKDGVIVADRSALYSYGLCCFASLSADVAETCALLCSGVLDSCVISDGVKNAGKSHQTKSSSIYIEISRLFGMLSLFGDRLGVEQMYTVAHEITDLCGCKLQYLSLDGEILPERMGIIYSSSAFALTCAALSFSMPDTDGCVRISVGREGIQMSASAVACGVVDALAYLGSVCEMRDMSMSVHVDGKEIKTNIFPFYADVGLVGVKNYLNFNFDLN